jgi:hypothetical protein
MSVTLGSRLPRARGRRMPRVGRLACSSWLPVAVALGVVAALVGVLAWPMLFTTSGLGGDWEHHLWYVWQQSLAIRANGAPSFFLNTPYASFYPQYAFYGGTINAIAGALALALGNSANAAYVLTYVLGFGAAYGGWYWLARSASLDRWSSHAPALLFVTSACYLTLVYGSGDWAEFLAMSMIPAMVAASVSVLKAERLRLAPAIALATSTIVFFGAHDLTVLWASSFAIVVGAALLICVPHVRRALEPRRVLRVAAVVLPSALIDAWFLVPTLAYSSHTKIASNYAVARETLYETMHLVSFAHLFTLSRRPTTIHVPAYVLSLPTLAIAWVLVSIAAVLVWARRGAWLRILVICSAATAGIVVLMTHAGLVLSLPKPYRLIQFTYRLEGFVLMGVVAAVLAILVIARSGSRRLQAWSWTLAPVLVLSTVGAVVQVDAYPHTPLPRSAVFSSRGQIYSELYDDYSYAPLPLIGGRPLPKLVISPSQINDNSVSMTIHVHPGQLADTNIGGGPDLLHIAGASVAGRDAEYHLVLALGSGPAAPPAERPGTPLATVHLSIGPAQSLPVILGRSLTLVGAIVLLGGLVVLLVHARIRRSKSP